MSAPQTDRPVVPLLLYRVTAEALGAVSAWTNDLSALVPSGITWWAQIDPERLLAYDAARHQWLVDTRGLNVEKLEERKTARAATSAAHSAPSYSR